MSTKKKILRAVLGIEIVAIAAVIAFLFYMNSDTVKVNRQLELAQRYLLEEDYEQAIAAFEVVIEIDPKSAEAYLGLADVYIVLGDIDGANEILRQGYDITGSDIILNIIKEMNLQIETTGSEIFSQIIGKLSISDFSYEYEDGGFLAESNEGAVGGLNLFFTVDGPVGVDDVLIWTWSDSGSFTSEMIDGAISTAISTWTGQVTVQPSELPFRVEVGCPVTPEERETIQDILLIGVDEQMRAVGYTIVTVAIP